MTMRGKFTGATVDEYRIVSAFKYLDDALRLAPPRGQWREWPKLEEVMGHVEDAMIELAQCGADVHPKPTEGNK